MEYIANMINRRTGSRSGQANGRMRNIYVTHNHGHTCIAMCYAHTLDSHRAGQSPWDCTLHCAPFLIGHAFTGETRAESTSRFKMTYAC